jgi:hypothetical protein
MKSTVHSTNEKLYIEKGEENTDKQKVYYKYVNDSVEKNMPAENVGKLITKLRSDFEKINPISCIDYKTAIREDAEIDKFAQEHPRIFDTVLSRYSTAKDIEMIHTMVRFRHAVDNKKMPENHAKAALNELLLKHNSKPIDTDREKMADDRIDRKVEEGSYLGFDPNSIPELKREYSKQMGNL